MSQRRDQGGTGWVWAIGLCLAVAWCSTSKPEKAAAVDSAVVAAADDGDASAGDDDTEVSSAGDGAENPDADLLASDIERGGETYQEYDTRRDQLDTGLYSGGYGCTQDCSGHDAGREWAERRGVSDESECGGNSWSFAEGCRSYAREQGGGADDDTADEGTL